MPPASANFVVVFDCDARPNGGGSITQIDDDLKAELEELELLAAGIQKVHANKDKSWAGLDDDAIFNKIPASKPGQKTPLTYSKKGVRGQCRKGKPVSSAASSCSADSSFRYQGCGDTASHDTASTDGQTISTSGTSGEERGGIGGHCEDDSYYGTATQGSTCESSSLKTSLTGYDLRRFVKESEFQSDLSKVDRTIAELFPDATVLFADVSGFTAWSSMREANQVFTLLEGIFQAFDAIARRLGVFKIETVGDCYVAVCGLPDANSDNALTMVRFARECAEKFQEVIHDLGSVLGPDTYELAIRIGINSGPITAGVIRGDRPRLQIFGDTVNTAARIEATGHRGRIHLSDRTANILKESGYAEWVTLRKDIVAAKGKGRMTTYWLNQRPVVAPAVDLRSLQNNLHQDRVARCIDWSSDLLLKLLKNIVAHRVALRGKHKLSANDQALKNKARTIGNGKLIVQEVANIIDLPDFDERAKLTNPDEVVLPSEVATQCRAYVAKLASKYHNNPFHNFEHATHVTMSVYKLLSRVVAPKVAEESEIDFSKSEERLKHELTYGITSDPLTQFSVVLSALIHDVDHRGVPNGRLGQEDKALANAYKNKSVAEQNSIEIGWEILLSDEFEAFRSCIFDDEAGLQHFRQLLVNSVIATDIFDKEQSTLRKNRWSEAFSHNDSTRRDIQRKATIVIEHMIQASDVSHTMQHWHVYQKWNERLFRENCLAHVKKRGDRNPSEGWYKGELWFFDNYVIPLAKKLRNCGVFGVSSDEYLTYAVTNRDEWADKGESIVQGWKKKYLPEEQ